jgi:hypothetical protein
MGIEKVFHNRFSPQRRGIISGMIPLLSVSENSGTIGFSGLAGQVFSGCRNAFPASAAGNTAYYSVEKIRY